MILFHLDMWEARFMFIINWILNWLVNWLLMAAVLTAMSHAKFRDDGDRPSKPGKPGTEKVWEDKDDD